MKPRFVGAPALPCLSRHKIPSPPQREAFTYNQSTHTYTHTKRRARNCRQRTMTLPMLKAEYTQVVALDRCFSGTSLRIPRTPRHRSTRHVITTNASCPRHTLHIGHNARLVTTARGTPSWPSPCQRDRSDLNGRRNMQAQIQYGFAWLPSLDDNVWFRDAR